MNKLLIIIVILTATFGCKDNFSKKCLNERTKTLFLLKNSIKIKIPESWINFDSTKYYSATTLYSGIFGTADTLNHIWIDINDYSKYEDVNLEFEPLVARMKAKIRSFKRGKDSLLTEDVAKINGHTINFLKYIVKNTQGQMYIGHIFLLIPPKKQVEIFIQTYSERDGESLSNLNCILNSFEIN